MAMQDLASALRRVESVLVRRPATGMHDDAFSVVRWDGGTRMIAAHADGHEMVTDLAPQLGGSGDAVSPGWMLRSGVASCTATCIVMYAALEGIELGALEVRADSRSDLRGLFGLSEEDGAPVDSGPQEIVLTVKIAAPGVAPERLRDLVRKSHSQAPMSAAMVRARAIGLDIQIVEG